MYKVFLIFDRKFVIDSYPAAEIIAKRFGSQIEDLFVCNAIPDASRRCQKPYCQLRRSVHAIAEASTHIKRGDLIRFLARTCCTDADLMAQLFRAHWPVHTEYELVELLRDASGDKKSWREASAGAARVTSSRFLSFFLCNPTGEGYFIGAIRWRAETSNVKTVYGNSSRRLILNSPSFPP